MSAIGDYIHYSRSGYEQFGTRTGKKRKGKDNWKGKGVGYKFNRPEIPRYDGIPEADIQQLRNLLRAMYGGKEGRSKVGENNLADQIDNAILTQLSSAFREITAWGDVRTISSAAAVRRAETQLPLSTNYVSLNAYIKNLDRLIDFTNKMRGGVIKLGTGKNQVKYTVDQIRILKGQLETAYEDATRIFLNGEGGSKQNFVVGKVDKQGNIISQETIKTILNPRIVEQLINAARAAGTLNKDKGLAFEYAVHALGMKMDDAADKEIIDFITSATTKTAGSDTHKVEFSQDRFSKKAVESKNFDNEFWTSHVNPNVPNKVDVNVQVKGRPLRANVKNYNLKASSSVKVLEDMNLLRALEQSSSDMFINHYLNLVVTSQGKDGNSHGPIEPNGFKDGARAEAAFSILKIALMGTPQEVAQGGSLANLFIVNDNTSADVHIYTIADIYSKCLNNLNAFSVTVGGTNILDYSPIQNWAGKETLSMTMAYRRIADLIMRLASVTVRVAIKTKVIQGN